MKGEGDSGLGETQGQRCAQSIFVSFRSESWTLKKPKIVSKKLKSAFRAPDLSRILQLFKGEESQRKGVGVRFL